MSTLTTVHAWLPADCHPRRAAAARRCDQRFARRPPQLLMLLPSSHLALHGVRNLITVDHFYARGAQLRSDRALAAGDAAAEAGDAH